MHVNSSINNQGIKVYRVSGGGIEISALEILSNHMNGKELIAKKKDQDPYSFKVDTLKAEAVLQETILKIKTLVSERQDLAERAENSFNTLFRNYVKPDYSKASYLLADVLAEIEETNPTVYSVREETSPVKTP